MKKTTILVLAVLISIVSYCQEFDGVKLSGDMQTAINAYKAKGYTLSEYKDNIAILDGTILSMKIELMLFVTPKTKKIFKAAVYLPKEEDWTTIKRQFYDYLEILRGKYGTETNLYEFFKKPYFEGDGYEMTAVGSENCTYAAMWFDEKSLTNTNIGLEISKYKQLKITYENVQNMKIARAEIDAVKNKSF